MDFTIVSGGLSGQMTFDPVTNYLNNVFLSLDVTQGNFFQNPGFGLRSLARMKNSMKNANNVVEYVKDALQWLINIGRATKIDIAYEIDTLQNINRLKLLITVTQANGQQVTFTKFVKVV